MATSFFGGSFFGGELFNTVAVLFGGGGAARRIKRRKGKPLWDEMSEIYDSLLEIGNATELAEVVAEYVEPSKPSPVIPAAVALPIPPPQIDWKALARDMDTVYRLVALYEKSIADQQDEEEAEMLLFT